MDGTHGKGKRKDYVNSIHVLHVLHSKSSPSSGLLGLLGCPADLYSNIELLHAAEMY